jgi:hypothetical protein
VRGRVSAAIRSFARRVAGVVVGDRHLLIGRDTVRPPLPDLVLVLTDGPRQSGSVFPTRSSCTPAAPSGAGLWSRRGLLLPPAPQAAGRLLGLLEIVIRGAPEDDTARHPPDGAGDVQLAGNLERAWRVLSHVPDGMIDLSTGPQERWEQVVLRWLRHHPDQSRPGDW